MKLWLSRAAKLYLLFSLIIIAFSYIYNPAPTFWTNLAHRTGAAIDDIWFPVSAVDQTWYFLSIVTPLLIIGVLVAALILLVTISKLNKTITIWKWCIGIMIALIPSPFLLTFLVCSNSKPGDACGDIILLFAPIYIIIFPLLFISLGGLLFSEWRARKRLSLSV